MFGRLLLTAASYAVALTASAHAADIVMKAPAYAPAMSWTGFYAGANAGFGSATVEPGVGGSSSSNLDGITGGGQIGYNWQLGATPLLFGIEADIQASSQDRSDSAFAVLTVGQELQWFGTVRGRLGYTVGPWLFYGTGGYAYGRYKMTVTGPLNGSGSTRPDGWTLGGGVEWMVMPRWSIKAEYLYMDFGTQSLTFAGGLLTAQTDLTDQVVRVGLNYHF
jgi:outer membrane immunogenic protein